MTKKAAKKRDPNAARDKARKRASKFKENHLTTPAAEAEKKKKAKQHFRVTMLCPVGDGLSTTTAEDVTKTRVKNGKDGKDVSLVLKFPCPRCKKALEVMPNLVSFTHLDQDDHELRQVVEIGQHD
jgi:hypothetical protein